MTALVIIEAIVIGLLVVLVAGLLRSHGEILRKLDALGAGEDVESTGLHTPIRRTSGLGESPLTTLTGPSPHGGMVSIALSGSRGFTLLAFLSSTCSSCGAFWQGLDQEVEIPGVRTVVVTRGPTEESPSEIARLAAPTVTSVMSSDAWDAFKVPATPYFALIETSSAKIVGEGSALTWPRVADMVRRAISDATHPLHRSTPARIADIDAELAAVGIEPGDPRLYQPPAS